MSDTEVSGPAGKAVLVPIADPTNPQAAMTVTQWLLEVPGAHPAWHQYVLIVVGLADHPGFPPPNMHYPEATHELLVLALDPDDGPYDVAKLQSYEKTGRLPWLRPPSVVAQVTASEAEVVELARVAVRSICDGLELPEPPFSTQSHWDHWKHLLDLSLEHLRGGH